MTQKLPTFFISHGGGPAFWIQWNPVDLFDKLKKSLEEVPALVGSLPKSILIISAHWEENEFTVQSTQNPSMIYDYQGFPPHTYQLQYNSPGSPVLAKRVVELLEKDKIKVAVNYHRGYDHGAFVPLMVMYPLANIPVVQLSVKYGCDSEEHYKLGQSLSKLREEEVLIIGSGFSFHNLGHFSDPRGLSKGFDDWLNTSITQKTGELRRKELLNWQQAPGAKFCHPTPEHLIPLMVAAGAAENEPGFRFYNEQMKKFQFWTSSFQFGKN